MIQDTAQELAPEIRLLRPSDKHQFLNLLTEFRPANLPHDVFIGILKIRISRGTLTYVMLTPTRELIGTASLVPDVKFINDGSTAGFVEDVVIKKEYQRKGYGSLLLERLKKDAKTLQMYKLVLSCEVKNIGFYEKNGFVKQGGGTMRFNIL